MPEKLFDLPGDVIINHGPCQWCDKPVVYDGGTGCKHGPPPVGCLTHGLHTDINLVCRGKRAVIKCTHYANAAVVLYADPSPDTVMGGTYTLQFFMRGVGHELYTIKRRSGQCPHQAYDKLVDEMKNGARPNQNRVPDPMRRAVEPGEGFGDDRP